MNTAGEYVDATPIPDTVLVNIGDLMQRWTADELKSTVFTLLFNAGKYSTTKL